MSKRRFYTMEDHIYGCGYKVLEVEDSDVEDDKIYLSGWSISIEDESAYEYWQEDTDGTFEIIEVVDSRVNGNEVEEVVKNANGDYFLRFRFTWTYAPYYDEIIIQYFSLSGRMSWKEAQQEYVGF